MTMADVTTGGRSGAREIRVWDPLVRLVHWSVAAAVLVNSFTDGEASPHHWIGYVAMALIAIRLSWGFIGPAPARFSSFPPDPRAAIEHARAIAHGDRRAHISHNPLGALMVYNLWLALAAIGLTGYLMTTRQFFGVEWMEDAHEVAYNWLILSVALHVGGVIFDSMRTGVNLARAMVTGVKRIPPGTEIE